jgi:peptidoglycan/LPS O-acetylase OafA/YrhL
VRRNFGLDLLRSIAILVVLANHAFLGFFVFFGQARFEGKAAFVSTLSFFSIEWLFVLSGFLIGTIMIRSFERGSTFWVRAKDFWLRRWFRTFPNYYLFLLVNILAGVIGIGQGEYSWRYAFFAQNLAWREDYPFFFSEAWTLALDEWFYFVMPLLVGLAAWRGWLAPRTAFVFATVLLIGAPTLARAIAAPPVDGYAWDYDFRRVTLFHLDATGWGVLAAIVNRWWPAFWERARGTKALLGVALMAGGMALTQEIFFDWGWATSWPRLTNVLRLSLMPAGTFLALPWLTSIPAATGWRLRGVEAVSLYSYSLYLCHIPMMYVLRAAISPAEAASPALWAHVAVWLALTFGLAALVYHAFEKPTSDLRERFTRHVDANPFRDRNAQDPA